MISLIEIDAETENRLAKKIQIGLKKMLKNNVYEKNILEIKKDLNEIKKEIKQNLSEFKILKNKKGDISAFFYIKANLNEKFIKPFFETEIFYSEDPESFFKAFKEAEKSLINLKNRYPEIKQYIGYFTIDEQGNFLSHAQWSKRKINKIFDKKMKFKDVFKTFIGKV
jgi:hypothetical protein